MIYKLAFVALQSNINDQIYQDQILQSEIVLYICGNSLG